MVLSYVEIVQLSKRFSFSLREQALLSELISTANSTFGGSTEIITFPHKH